MVDFRCKKVLAGEEINNSTNSQNFFNNRTISESSQGFTITRPTQLNERSRRDSTSSSHHGGQHFNRVGGFSSTTSEESVGLHKFNRENIPNQNHSMDKGRSFNQNKKSVTQNGYTTEPKRNDDRKEQCPRLPYIRFDKVFHNVSLG